MAPFSCQPAVIVVQPSNHRSYVEGAIDRIENIWCTGHSSTIWDNGSLNDRPEKLGTFFESKGFEAAADCIKEDVTCGFILSRAESQWQTESRVLARLFTYSEIGINFVVVDVAGHVFDLWIEFSDAGHCGGIGP